MLLVVSLPPANLKDSLASIKGKVILVNKSAVGVFRWSEGFLPYIIAFDWMVLNVYESAIDPKVAPIFSNTIVEEWTETLKNALEEKAIGNKSVSALYKTHLVERKFIDFFALEACLEFFMCHYLNIRHFIPSDTQPPTPLTTSEEVQVRSVGISMKRPAQEHHNNHTQQNKKRKPSIIPEDDYVDYTDNDVIEFPASSHPTPRTTKQYTLEEFLTAEEYQSQVINALWGSEFEIPDSAIIPKSTEIVENTPIVNNEIPIKTTPTPTPTPNPTTTTENTTNTPAATFNNNDNTSSTTTPPPQPSASQPELTQSSQLNLDTEMEETQPNALYAAAEAVIMDQIYKVGASTFERRRGFANLRNLRLQRDMCNFISTTSR